jgi:predicted outer membrane repeat protein
MIGELIPTGVTFGAGRISVNDQFSGTAEFNDVEVSGNLSAGTGGVIYSGGTDLYNIFGSPSGNYLPLSVSANTIVTFNANTLVFSGDATSLFAQYIYDGTVGHGLITNNSYSYAYSAHDPNQDFFYAGTNQSNGAFLEYSTGTTVNLFKVTKSSMRAESSVPTFNGITYDIDYSSNYTNRSLVDKQYVDLAVASGGGGGVEPYLNLGTTGSTINWNVSGLSTNYRVTLSAATTLNLTNVRNGEYGTIIVTQDGVGGRTITLGTVNGALATHRVVNGGGGVLTLTSTASATDILSFTYNGSAMYWTVGNDYT